MTAQSKDIERLERALEATRELAKDEADAIKADLRKIQNWVAYMLEKHGQQWTILDRHRARAFANRKR